jgi:hypothetical protein
MADPGGRVFCSRLIAGTAASNTAEGMDVCPWCLLFVVFVAASAKC